MNKYLFSILLLLSNIFRILTQKEKDLNFSKTYGLNKFYEIVNSCILRNTNGEIKDKLTKLFDKNDNITSFGRFSLFCNSDELKELIENCKQYGILKKIKIPSFAKNRTGSYKSPCYNGFDYQTGNIVHENSTLCNKDQNSLTNSSINDNPDFDYLYAKKRESERKEIERKIELEKGNIKEDKLNKYLKKGKERIVNERKTSEFIRNLIKKLK